MAGVVNCDRSIVRGTSRGNGAIETRHDVVIGSSYEIPDYLTLGNTLTTKGPKFAAIGFTASKIGSNEWIFTDFLYTFATKTFLAAMSGS